MSKIELWLPLLFNTIVLGLMTSVFIRDTCFSRRRNKEKDGKGE